MKVTIFGSGYVGLVTGACLAETGNQVVVIDVDPDRVASLNAGEIPIHEPGIQSIIQRGLDSGRLKFTTDVELAVNHGLLQFIAVGTPTDDDGSADLKHVLSVARSIGTLMTEHRVVVNKSTVPVGTADAVQAEIQSALDRRGEDLDFDVVSNPEFLKEGAAVEDFTKPDRVIIGTDNPRAAELLRSLYEPFNRNRDRMLLMDPRSAELTKYAANAMLATKISLMNELANLAERTGADIEQVRIGIGADHRIGYDYLYPGCGYGGSCLPKDVKALAAAAASHDFTPTLLTAVDQVNQQQKHALGEKISAYFNDDLTGKTIALWGLAFKPNTDDIREASSRSLMEQLWARGAQVRAYDPVANDQVRKTYGDRQDLVLCDTAQAALVGADALAIVTEWREFRSPDFEHIREQLSHSVIFDGRNLYDPSHVAHQGLSYFAIGRGDSVHN